MECYVKLNEVKRLIESDDLAKFLLSHSTDFGACAFILQTVRDKLKEIERRMNNNNGK